MYRYYAHKSPQSSLGERLASNPGEDLLEGWRGRTSRKHHRTSAEVGRRAEGHVAAGEDLEVSGMGMLLFMRLVIGEFLKQEPQKRLDLALQFIVRCRFSLKATAVSIASPWSSPWVLPHCGTCSRHEGNESSILPSMYLLLVDLDNRIQIYIHVCASEGETAPVVVNVFENTHFWPGWGGGVNVHVNLRHMHMLRHVTGLGGC